MSEVTEEKLFPRDQFNPALFSRREREYLKKFMGAFTPRKAFEEELPPEGANPKACEVALRRFHDEAQSQTGKRMIKRCLQAIDLQDETDKRKRRQTHAYGEVAYESIGVGVGAGQTSIEQRFTVNLSNKTTPPTDDFAADLLEKWRSGEELLSEEREVRCLFCDDYVATGKGGKDPYKAVRMHVQQKNRHGDEDHDVDAWMAFEEEQRAAIEEAVSAAS